VVDFIKAKELRSLSAGDLENRERDLALELNIERRKVASTGVASKTAKTREIRRTIARIKTIQNERKRGAKT
jgi:large subunit ribosomal protein L29